MQTEVWKPWRDGDYAVSNVGRIKRVRAKRGAVVGRILKVGLLKNGYSHICLYVRGRKCGFLVHRLVAEVFIGPCPSGKEVNHKNGIKPDCSAKNLEYVTSIENKRHAIENGLFRRNTKFGWQHESRISN